MFISVYTIAKNEEKVAERWFNCFKEADEVCVLVNNSITLGRTPAGNQAKVISCKCYGKCQQ